MQALLLSAFLVTHLIPGLLRGPYLQSATSTSIIIRWRTDVPTDSRVAFGPAPGSFTQHVDSAALRTEHEVKLSGLQPSKRYYYSIGSSQEVLQGDSDNFFETAPPPGQQGKYRIGVFGDCGKNSVIQINVRDNLTGFLGNEYMNAWLLLGDNAYQAGTDAEYQSGFFNIYKQKFLKQSPLYPCPGNHDYANDAQRQVDHAVPYYNLFTVPVAGEAGGAASGTEAFYSFDYGNIHFLSLDSYGKENGSTRLYDTLGAQVQWIKADLAANTNKEWVVAYWHHPPFTKGSHNSDTETELVSIRENFIRILERNGVDLILCGHSHDYERSKLMKGHYGVESSFSAADHNISQSSGKYDGSPDSCPYLKKSSDNQGTVYVVAGSAGQLGSTKAGYPHDALPMADSQHGGALLLEVEGKRLDAKWIASDGLVRDQFTIVKDANVKAMMEIEKGESVTLSASYVGEYLWSTGANTQEVTVSPSITTDYYVHDAYACLSDSITVEVSNPLPVQLINFSGSFENGVVDLRWQTSEETNAGYFVIERSPDGRQFKPIGEVAATGDSRETRNYFYRDAEIAARVGKAYYRLVEVDLDGRKQTSSIIAISLANAGDSRIRVQPNPSDGKGITIEIAEQLGNCELTLTEITGRVLEKRKVFSGKKPLNISFGTKKAGVYIITLIINGESISKKVIVE